MSFLSPENLSVLRVFANPLHPLAQVKPQKNPIGGMGLLFPGQEDKQLPALAEIHWDVCLERELLEPEG